MVRNPRPLSPIVVLLYKNASLKSRRHNTRLLKMMSISAKSPEVLYSSSLRGKYPSSSSSSRSV